MININNNIDMRTPCLIRKNTPELRRKLEELGLESMNIDGTTLDAHNYDGKGNHRSIDEGTAIITYLSNNYGVIYDIDSVALKNRIDCGTNEDLFLAIAALKDDTWEGQWIVVPKIEIRRLPGYFGQTCGMDGHYTKVIGHEWIVCDRPDLDKTIKFYIELGDDPKTLPHKATIDELIEHFNK